jgi:putative hydrolase of the HAD superfamily
MRSYFQSIFQENKIDLSDEEVDTMLADELVLFENYVASHHMTLNARDRAQTVLKLAGIELPEEKLLRVAYDCDHMALEARPPMVSKARETLSQIAETYKIGLVCNTGFHGATTVKELLSGHGLLPYLQHMTFSDQAGVAKPNIRIFQEALNKLGCLPRESVHVGDSEPADIKGAKHFGMFAVLFTGANDRYQQENSADAVIGSLSELAGILESIGR